MIATIMKNILSMRRYATIVKIAMMAAILIPLPIIAFVMHQSGFVHQLRALKISLDQTMTSGSSTAVKLQELDRALVWVKRELIRVPSNKMQRDKSQFSWNGLLFDPSCMLFYHCLAQSDACQYQLLIQKILVQVDAICAEFTEPSDLFFDADLGYLAQAWQLKMHQALQANMKKKLEEFFDKKINQKSLLVQPITTATNKSSHASGSSVSASDDVSTKSAARSDQNLPEYFSAYDEYPTGVDEFGRQDSLDQDRQKDLPEQKTEARSKKKRSDKSSHDSPNVTDEMRSFLGDNGHSNNLGDMFSGKDANWAHQMKLSLDDMRERQRKYEIIRDSAMENHKQQSFQNIKRNAIALLTD